MRNPPVERRIRAALVGLAAALLTALPALAHGPTVRVSYDGPRPARIAIRAGQTIHFQNAGTTARSFTLVADDGSFASPTLARGEGWHYTFGTAGQFAYHLAEHPDRKGLVVVGPAD